MPVHRLLDHDCAGLPASGPPLPGLRGNVMSAGYKGYRGITEAHLGPVPEGTVMMCAGCKITFYPLMMVETVLRPPR